MPKDDDTDRESLEVEDDWPIETFDDFSIGRAEWLRQNFPELPQKSLVFVALSINALFETLRDIRLANHIAFLRIFEDKLCVEYSPTNLDKVIAHLNGMQPLKEHDPAADLIRTIRDAAQEAGNESWPPRLMLAHGAITYRTVCEALDTQHLSKKSIGDFLYKFIFHLTDEVLSLDRYDEIEKKAGMRALLGFRFIQ